jgi:cob(I)alamin adenosyltransferase
LDELNSLLGWCACADGQGLLAGQIQAIQRELFAMGAELSTPPGSRARSQGPRLGVQEIERLEAWIDEAGAQVEPLRHFVLPGGTELAARLHLARTVCRRVERAVVSLARNGEARMDLIVYLNRLSDLLFAWARLANHAAGVPDLPWMPNP